MFHSVLASRETMWRELDISQNPNPKLERYDEKYPDQSYSISSFHIGIYDYFCATMPEERYSGFR
jgi:hypothetical protein